LSSLCVQNNTHIKTSYTVRIRCKSSWWCHSVIAESLPHGS